MQFWEFTYACNVQFWEFMYAVLGIYVCMQFWECKDIAFKLLQFVYNVDAFALSYYCT